MVDKFHLLKLGQAVILAFFSGKVLIIDSYRIPIVLFLAVIAIILALSIIGSLLFHEAAEAELSHDEHHDVLEEAARLRTAPLYRVRNGTIRFGEFANTFPAARSGAWDCISLG